MSDEIKVDKEEVTSFAEDHSDVKEASIFDGETSIPEDEVYENEGEAWLKEADKTDELPEFKGKLDPIKFLNYSTPLKELGPIQESKWKDGGVVGPNYTLDEVTAIVLSIFNDIILSQESRRKVNHEGLEEGYTLLENPFASDEANPEDRLLIATTKEAQMIAKANAHRILLASSPYDVFDDVEENDGWTNRPEFKGAKAGVKTIRQGNPIGIIQDSLGISSRLWVTLPSSGFSTKIKATSLLDSRFLLDRIAEDKIQLSRSTFGHALESTSVYVNEALFETILPYATMTNMGELSTKQLAEELSVLDMQLLITAFADATYREGFKLERPCISSKADTDCSHVDSWLINPRQSIITRWGRLNETQKSFITSYNQATTLSAVHNYREGLRPDVDRYFTFLESEERTRDGQMVTLKHIIKLRVPTYAQYLRISKAWMNSINNQANILATTSSDPNIREKIIHESNLRAEVMLYAHWVEGIYITNPDDVDGELLCALSRKDHLDVEMEEKIDADRELDQFLIDLTMNSEAHRKVVDAIVSFMKQMTLSAIVLPRTSCSECGHPHIPEGVESDDMDLIEINPYEIFFTLLRRKIRNV